jgi:hypothetical protein
MLLRTTTMHKKCGLRKMGIQEPQEVTAAALSQDVLDPQRLLVLK